MVMKRKWWPAAWAGLVILTIGTSRVDAQPPVPGGVYARPPSFSPYLNLMRGGSPAFNYYGLVRPELQFRQHLLYLENNVAMNQNAISNLNEGILDLNATGHPTQFMNLGGYFMNNSSTGTANYGYGAKSAMANRNRFSAQFAPGSLGGGTGSRIGTPTPTRK